MTRDQTFFALAATDTALAATGRTTLRHLTKPQLTRVLARGRDRPTRRALALSRSGDIALLRTSQAAFTMGLASFLGAQVAWIAALIVLCHI